MPAEREAGLWPFELEHDINTAGERVRAADRFAELAEALALMADDQNGKPQRGGVLKRLERLVDGAGRVLGVAAKARPPIPGVDDETAEFVLMAIRHRLFYELGPGSRARLVAQKHVSRFFVSAYRGCAWRDRNETEDPGFLGERVTALLSEHEHARGNRVEADERRSANKAGEQREDERRLADLGPAGEQADRERSDVAAPNPLRFGGMVSISDSIGVAFSPPSTFVSASLSKAIGGGIETLGVVVTVAGSNWSAPCTWCATWSSESGGLAPLAVQRFRRLDDRLGGTP